MDTRALIGVWQDVVGCVTGDADSRHRKALTIQSFTVNAHRVVLEDAILRNLVSPGYGRSFLVTVAAQ